MARANHLAHTPDGPAISGFGPSAVPGQIARLWDAVLQMMSAAQLDADVLDDQIEIALRADDAGQVSGSH